MATAIDDQQESAYLAGVADDIIRDAIMREVDRRKLTAYGLWKLVEGKISRTTVHQLVNGEMNRGLTTQAATHLLTALDITLRPKK